MEDKTLQMSLLLDFYGGLLSPRQQQVIDLYFNENLSLGEIALNEGITRQAVRDSLVKGENALLELEGTVGALRRYEAVRALSLELEALAESNPGIKGELLRISSELRSETGGV